MKEETKPLVLPFGPIQGVEWVTTHCMARFRERAGVKGTHGEQLRHLEGWMTKARLVELKPEKRLNKILNHGCRIAKYYLMGNPRKGAGWILVVEEKTLKTIHRNEACEWMLPNGSDD